LVKRFETCPYDFCPAGTIFALKGQQNE
jgi:hypothetical protein